MAQLSEEYITLETMNVDPRFQRVNVLRSSNAHTDAFAGMLIANPSPHTADTLNFLNRPVDTSKLKRAKNRQMHAQTSVCFPLLY